MADIHATAPPTGSGEEHVSNLHGHNVLSEAGFTRDEFLHLVDVGWPPPREEATQPAARSGGLDWPYACPPSDYGGSHAKRGVGGPAATMGNWSGHDGVWVD